MDGRCYCVWCGAAEFRMNIRDSVYIVVPYNIGNYETLRLNYAPYGDETFRFN